MIPSNVTVVVALPQIKDCLDPVDGDRCIARDISPRYFHGLLFLYMKSKLARDFTRAGGRSRCIANEAIVFRPIAKKALMFQCRTQHTTTGTRIPAHLTRALKLTYGRDPVILFMPMENPGDRLAHSMSARRGTHSFPTSLFWHSGYELGYTVPTGGISAPNVPHSFHRIDLNY